VTSYVADTHALFWYLTASPRLGSQAKAAFDRGAAGQATILIPAIVLAELHYVNEKAGRPLSFSQELAKLGQAGQFTFVSLHGHGCHRL
jgi:predicted nucleic acid-binding protein